MKPEPDAVAIDLITRLTEEISNNMWTPYAYCSAYGCYASSCIFCLRDKMKHHSTPIHAENCRGVKLLIESLNYIHTNSKC